MLATETVVQLSSVAELRAIGGPLFAAHRDELRAVRPGEPDLDINWDAFVATEARRDLLCHIAWVAGELVGYSVASFFRHPLCRSELILLSFAVFVSPAARGSGVWHALSTAVRDAADASGARLVWNAYAGTRAATVFEHRCGPARELSFYDR